MASDSGFDDPDESYSINTFPGNGATTSWELNFAGGFISQSHIKAFKTNAAGVHTDVTFTWVGPNTISVSPAIPSLTTLTVYRDTPKEQPLVDYTDGAIINASNLDKTAQQSVFVAAEMVDRYTLLRDEVDTLIELTDPDTYDNLVADLTASVTSTSLPLVIAQGNTQVARVTTEGNAQDTRVITEGNTQTARVNSAGATQVAAINTASSVAPVSLAGTYPDVTTGLASGLSTFGVRAGKQVLLYNKLVTKAIYQSTIPSSPQASIAGVIAGSVSLDGAALPYGAVADFVAVDGLSAYGRLPNRAKDPGSINLLPADRPSDLPYIGLFQNGGNTVITQNVAGTSGSKAIRVQRTATGIIGAAVISVSIPPGQWSLALKAKSNGANQTLQFGMNSYFVTSNSMALTSSFQSFITAPEDFTVATVRELVIVMAYPTDATYDVTIDEVMLIPGNTATPALPFSSPAWSSTLQNRSGLVYENTASASGSWKFNLDSLQTLTAMTVCVAVKKTAAPALAFEAILGQTVETGFTYPSSAYWVGAYNGLPKSQGVTAQMSGLSSEWTVYCFTDGPGVSRVSVNGQTLISNTVGMNVNARVFEIMSIVDLPMTYGMRGKIAAITVWNRALSPAEELAAFKVQRSRISAQGEQFTLDGHTLVVEGDSTSIPDNAAVGGGYTSQVCRAVTPVMHGYNYAIAGSFMADIQGRQQQALDRCSAIIASGRKPILYIRVGQNDRPQTVAAADALWVALKAYLAPFKALPGGGVKIVVGTPIAMNPAANALYESTGRPRLTANILGEPTAYTAVANYSVTAMNTWSLTNYGDNLHQNAAGMAVQLPVLKAAIDTAVSLG